MRRIWGSVLGCFGVVAALAQERLAEVTPRAGWDALPPARFAGDDWPWWRGPQFDNVAPVGQHPPKSWGAVSNVVWRVRLPESGHSSPCVVGDRIYVTTGSKGKDLATVCLLCLDRATGNTVWQTEIYRGLPPKMHPDNSVASATPACDGERVFVPVQGHDQVSLVAVDTRGTLLWSVAVSPYGTIQGFSASPTLYRSAVIVPVEGPKGCYLTAFQRQTGEVVWRRSLRASVESYAPVAVARVAGREQLLLVGGSSTRGYDPGNGELLWECEGPARTCVATAVFDGEKVYATGGYPGRQFLAIRADGRGDVTKSHVAWTADAKVGYVPTPLVHGGLVYAVADQGLFRCYDAGDGHILWERDFKAPFYSSPVLADGSLYLFDRKGKGYVVPAGRAAGSITTNELPAGVFATPVVLQSRIYLRTLSDFYCLGRP